MNWTNRIKLKHLFTQEEDHENIQKSMNEIADVIEGTRIYSGMFVLFSLKEFRNIPKGDEYFKPIDYANKLIDRLYDFADDNRIWIE